MATAPETQKIFGVDLDTEIIEGPSELDLMLAVLRRQEVPFTFQEPSEEIITLANMRISGVSRESDEDFRIWGDVTRFVGKTTGSGSTEHLFFIGRYNHITKKGWLSFSEESTEWILPKSPV